MFMHTKLPVIKFKVKLYAYLHCLQNFLKLRVLQFCTISMYAFIGLYIIINLSIFYQ